MDATFNKNVQRLVLSSFGSLVLVVSQTSAAVRFLPGDGVLAEREDGDAYASALAANVHFEAVGHVLAERGQSSMQITKLIEDLFTDAHEGSPSWHARCWTGPTCTAASNM